ncbi:hypothetical protein COCON_G00151040 [Conger conger]|uniref:Pikachurin n=1 Tax=Conger conger TaxID=82655 RepID=A0A9Q1D861_CONCO|nr:hypothetical protein COCON_G00151040 [Conger conger]
MCPWPELDTEWTYIREPIETNSMVLKGLIPDTEYQFVVRAVNTHGASPPSAINYPVRTLGAEEVGSGTYGQRYITGSETYGEDLDDSDYDVYIEELKPFPGVPEDRKSQLRSRTGTGNVIYRRTTPVPDTPEPTPATATPWASSTGPEAYGVTAAPTMPAATTELPTASSVPASSVPASSVPASSVPASSIPASSVPASSTTTTPPTQGPAPSRPMTRWKGPVPRLYDLPCEDTVCPRDSFCVNDYDSGGSRCHCNLGRAGATCSEGVTVQYPQFYGYSHMTFEPLKNSYQTFQITLEFKAEAEDGLLLYCGENEHARGDYTSLALIRRKLHFRFNCGTGAAQMVSDSRVVLGRWHTVTLYRDGTSGWLRLDNDTPVSGRSQGQYTKITFRTPFFVGGAPSVYWLARAAGINRGFHGCVQAVNVNGKGLDMRPWPRGHALSGADIGECSESVCGGVTCAHGGTCYASRADRFICLCPLGFRGPLCEERFALTLPSFNQTLRSYTSAPWPQSSRHYLSFMEFEMTFRPTSPDGTLLYSEDTGSRDFLAITLADRYLEFCFDCGSGPAVIRSEERVSVGAWHELRVSRTAKNGILQVDNQRPMEGMAEGAFTQIKCNTPLYVGGVPNYDVTKSSAGILRPFSGDIQKVLLNDRTVPLTAGSAEGVNLENAAHPCVDQPCANGGTCRPKRDEYECDCPLGYDGRHCQKAVTEAIEIPQFIGRSYLTYDNRDILKRVTGSRTNVFMRFKSTAHDGLLLWRGDSPMRPNSDFLSLGLQDGALIFSYNLGSGVGAVMVNGTFSDGRWHRVKAVRDGQSGKLTVDDYGAKTGRSPGKMRQLNTNGVLYVGAHASADIPLLHPPGTWEEARTRSSGKNRGCHKDGDNISPAGDDGGMKEISLHTNRQYMRGLVGCISHFTLSTDYHLSLVEDAADGKNINTCNN